MKLWEKRRIWKFFELIRSSICKHRPYGIILPNSPIEWYTYIILRARMRSIHTNLDKIISVVDSVFSVFRFNNHPFMIISKSIRWHFLAALPYQMWLHFHKIIELQLSQSSPSPVLKLLSGFFYFQGKTGQDRPITAKVKRECNAKPFIHGITTFSILKYVGIGTRFLAECL